MPKLRKRPPQTKSRPRPQRNWGVIAKRCLKGFVVAIMALEVIALFDSSTGPTGRFTALLFLAAFALSTAYLLIVTPNVHIRLFGLDELIEERSSRQHDKGTKGLLNGVKALRRHATEQEEQHDDTLTIQVTRLETKAAFGTIVNDSPLPVLRGETGLVLTQEARGGDTPAPQVTDFVKTKAFSLPAHDSLSNAVTGTFDHVGIFRLQSTGVRIHDLLGLFSRTTGPVGEWRVRVVPNLYRLARGIAEQRKNIPWEDCLPDTSMDALDYDRVRDYRPGDSLRKIHWKLVAHRQGELYTKLYEEASFTTVTLLVDPYGADLQTMSLGSAYHLHDTMLEGGFSLLEHARDNGFLGLLRFVNRSGTLVESNWEGPPSLGWFVEVARRPESSLEAKDKSVVSIQSLLDGRAGYVIFATSALSERSVQELIACHHGGTPLVVVHAISTQQNSETARQKAFDERLRRASIGVVALTDGPQIVREVMAS